MGFFKKPANFESLKTRLKGGNFRQISENFLSLSSVQVLGYIFPLIILPYLVRTIGAEKYGLTETAVSFLGVFMMLTSYGFPYSASRQIAIARDDKVKVTEIFSSVLLLRIIFCLIGLVVLVVLTQTVSKFNEEKLLYLLSFGAVIGDVLFPIWLFQGLEQMRYISLLNLSARIVILVLTFWFVRTPQDYILVPLVNSIGLIFIGVISIIIIHKKLDIRFKLPSKLHLKFQLREGWSTFISGIAINLYTQPRVFIFSLFASEQLVGFYSIAQKTAGIFQVFPLTTLLNSALPRLNNIYSTNKRRSIELLLTMQKYSNYYSLITLPICFIFAPEIIHLISHQFIPESTTTLRILFFSVTIVNLNIFRVHYFIISGNYSLFSKLHTVASFFGLILMITLTGFFLHIGIAISSVVLELGVLITTYLLTRTYFIKDLA